LSFIIDVVWEEGLAEFLLFRSVLAGALKDTG